MSSIKNFVTFFIRILFHSVIAYISLSAISLSLAYERKVSRESLLVDETMKWSEYCRERGDTCESFVDCSLKFPLLNNCTALGGMLEYPTCNYWVGIKFDTQEHGEFDCVKKFIQLDLKNRCKTKETMISCGAFVDCCKWEDDRECAQYFSGELEYPACHALKDKPFDYKQAVCRCAVDSPGETPIGNTTGKDKTKKPWVWVSTTRLINYRPENKTTRDGNANIQSCSTKIQSNSMAILSFVLVSMIYL